MVQNSMNSHRPLHEQEQIEREIRKNSKIVGTSNVVSPRVKGPPGGPIGIQHPMMGRSNVMKVFHLNDIILSQ